MLSCKSDALFMSAYEFGMVRGRRVTAFGVLYNFSGNDQNTTVQKVEDMVKETWVRAASLSFSAPGRRQLVVVHRCY
jgi:hypothetical protein